MSPHLIFSEKQCMFSLVGTAYHDDRNSIALKNMKMFDVTRAIISDPYVTMIYGFICVLTPVGPAGLCWELLAQYVQILNLNVACEPEWAAFICMDERGFYTLRSLARFCWIAVDCYHW